jgi:hypothetical protein
MQVSRVERQQHSSRAQSAEKSKAYASRKPAGGMLVVGSSGAV